METNTRLHPLLTAAAISVTVFSAVGVAALTGIVPHSFGSQQEVAPLQVSPIAQEVAKPAVEAPVAKPAPKKRVTRTSAPKPVEPVMYREFTEEPRLAQVETPKPVVQPGNLATIQAVREVKDPGQHTGLGPIAGGAFAGREIEKHARATKHWEIDLRRDDGAYETVRSDVQPPYQAGERIRVFEGKLLPA